LVKTEVRGIEQKTEVRGPRVQVSGVRRRMSEVREQKSEDRRAEEGRQRTGKVVAKVPIYCGCLFAWYVTITALIGNN